MDSPKALDELKSKIKAESPATHEYEGASYVLMIAPHAFENKDLEEINIDTQKKKPNNKNDEEASLKNNTTSVSITGSSDWIKSCYDSDGSYVWDGADDWVVDDLCREPYAHEKLRQRQLQGRCSLYRNPRFYRPEEEIRTCIWSKGDPFSWTEKTTGISWIGVNGTDAVYVVAMNEKPKPPSHRNELATISVLFMALCDMGVWADTSTVATEFRRKMIAQSSSRNVGPFAVVCIAPGTAAADYLGSSNKGSPAIDFLRQKLIGRSDLDYEEIKQIAVRALKYMLGSKFDPDKIEVMGNGCRGGEGPFHDAEFGAYEVEELLAGYEANLKRSTLVSSA